MKDEWEGRFVLMDAEGVVERECADKAMKEADLALTYMFAIYAEAHGEIIDWRRLNHAIICRFRFSGLKRIKKEAWKRI